MHNGVYRSIATVTISNNVSIAMEPLSDNPLFTSFVETEIENYISKEDINYKPAGK